MLKDLLDEIAAARAAAEVDKARRERIRKLLIDVRLQRPDLTVVDIEQQIGRFYDRGTISRITAAAAGKSSKSAQS